jgi:CHAT domain-containing protein
VVASRSAPTRGRQVAALPCTNVEVQHAGAALHAGGLSVVTDVGLAASKTHFDAVTGPRVVHIATHGFFFADSSTDASARFAMGGAASNEDPMMRSGLTLAGGGETWRGSRCAPADESMWEVPDREKQELLQAFYAKWMSGTSVYNGAARCRSARA